MIRFLLFLCFCTLSNLYAQNNYSVENLPKSLTENAYAIVRTDDTKVEFFQSDKVKYTTETAITVLNESGLKYAYNFISYDKHRKISKFEATLYNAAGKEIRKLKSKDLKDVSAYDGFSLYIDDRIQYYDFTPTSYPFTIHYKVEINSSNTISLPSWTPISGYDVSVENSSLTLINHSGIRIRKKESGFDFCEVKKSESGNILTYSAQNIPALQNEILSPILRDLTPRVYFTPQEFQLAGVKGNFQNWEEFGKWYYQNLLYDKQDLSEQDKKLAVQLVDGISDPTEKVRVLYQYMQSKTRYVNVAIGIGGWEPFPASYVSSKSYGDCKALSNYMISLLKTVGIDAFHTIVYGESGRKMDLDKDFASLQGNHMIINVPLEDETIWLECTSQQTAFNYLGQFTDDRLALSVTPKGGKIVSTQNFPAENNKELIKGKGEILPNGNLKAQFTIEVSGLKYDNVYRNFFESTKDQKQTMNLLFSDMPNLNLIDYKFENNRDEALFTTNAQLESTQFAKVFGGSMAVNLIPFERKKTSLKKDNNRRFPFEIRYGYTDETEFELKIPDGYKISEKFQPVLYADSFGTYLLVVEEKEKGKLNIKRKLIVKDGMYPKEKFNDYVEFQRKISSLDNSKILLEKI